ncbi:M14 family zinc carboxypeptidase [Terriglobus sp.]|uniref:M14 family zinc carboxypeptidase n=1 Tax=Terriglobus sp. TaxID=1889013 RepID=UPI003B005098
MPSKRLALSLSLCALCLGVLDTHAQREALRPHSAYEPPLAAAAATLTASQSSAPADLLTTGEKTNWQQTGDYAEVERLMHAMEKRSSSVRVVQFGTTPENRPMYAMIVSKDRAFTPDAAKRTGKAIILVQSGIHSGEIEGKDTSLMLVRDMVIAKRPHQAAWLDRAIFVVIPVFNIDGHESRSAFNRANQNGPQVAGTRQTAQLLNLNRDYVKAVSPEMRAWLRLYQAWLPDFMFDNHVTDGADYQYDVTWDMAHHGEIGEPARSWVNDRFIPQLNTRMQAGGHMVSPYGALRKMPNGRREFFVEVFSPRYSHIYSAAMNRPCLLVETHSLKEARTRAWSNYDIMTDAIDIVTEDPKALHDAVSASDAKDAAAAGDPNAAPVYLAGKTSDAAHPLVYYSLKIEPFQSAITGTEVTRYTADKDDIDTVIHDGIDTTAEAREPLGFLIPLAWKELADELALHGVAMQRTPVALDQVFDTWRFSDVKSITGAMEGGTLMDYKLTPVRERIQVPAGSWWVPMHQQRARLILSLLHPAAPDALIRLGFASAIFQPTGRVGAAEYLTVPIANKVAEEHPELMLAFQAKLAADPAFAADPRARVQWWIAQSNYQPSSFNRYPVLQLWKKPW